MLSESLISFFRCKSTFKWLFWCYDSNRINAMDYEQNNIATRTDNIVLDGQ